MKILLLLVVFTIALSGCSALYNLNGFVIPDDYGFLRVIESLDTPANICQYMYDNFDYKVHAHYAPSPYQFWQIKEGDCNDYSTFVTFVADYHGHETYQIALYFEGTIISHMIGVFKVNGKYNFSDCWNYMPIQADSFREIVNYYCSGYDTRWVISGYEVYDCNMKIIEEGSGG
jgi:hypothetical protein